ncbi:MAG: selenium cofactor biosynthesis protein YqeC [Ktedonobacteraceae bacterium]
MLSDIIAIPPGSLISLVGAGGKTTTMYTLASELAAQGKRVVTTTTTNIYIPKRGETDTLIVSTETPTLLKMLSSAWKQHHRVTVAARAIGAGKIAGLKPDQPYELLTKGGADVVIVEADGARHNMIKAPAEHEPLVPSQTTIALLLISAEALNQPLGAEIAHRPERIAAVLGINQGDKLTPHYVARLMVSDQGAMKHIPDAANVYLLLTHVLVEQKELIHEVVEQVLRSGKVKRVLCSPQPGEWSPAKSQGNSEDS